MQSRNGNIPAGDELAVDDSTEDPRMWYVRLRIRDDRLAKLWAWKLAEHDVIVWSEAEERWKQLLAVPELRAAVRKATTSAYVRKSTPPPALPASQFEGPDSRTRRRHLQTVAEFEGDELTTRVNRDSSFPDMEPTAVNYAPRSIKNASSVPPPPPVDMLRALSSTSIPPAPHSPATTQFPPAPKVPSITELARSSGVRAGGMQEPTSSSFLRPPTQSEYPAARSLHGVVTQSGYSPPASYPPSPSSYPPAQSSYPPPPSALQRRPPTQIQVARPAVARPPYVVAKPASQFTIKNLSWAMLPVACAGVFALFLDRYAPNPTVQSGPIVISADTEPGSGQLRPWLGSLLGMSLGAAQNSDSVVAKVQDPAPANQPSPNLTPEQLAPVSSPAKPSAPVSRGGGAYTGRVAGKIAGVVAKPDDKDKAGAASGNSGPAAAAAPAVNESFDRDGARTALKFAAARVRNCSNSGVTGSALITFGPSGTVQKVQVTQMVGDDVDASCVNRALAGTRVPPFTGAPVTVRKSF